MKLNELTINEYSTLLAAKKSAPGGGSALALVLELACDLGLMVANFTINKKGYEPYFEEINKITAALLEYKQIANRLIDEDAIAYKGVMDAFKSQEKKLIEQASIYACEVPFTLYTTTSEVEKLCSRLYEIGNKNLISDAKIGTELCKSIYSGCVDNIKCNIDNIASLDVKKKYLEILK